MAGRWNPRSARVEAVLSGYRQHVQLTAEECSAIAAAMPLHVFVRDCAEFCLGRMTFDEVSGGYAVISRLAAAVASRIAAES
jgi:hypothetical protein